MPIKCNTKKNSYCMSSNRIFFKDDLRDNHLVGHSGMNPVDATVFQKEEGNERSKR